jgi:hypothetical protein
MAFPMNHVIAVFQHFCLLYKSNKWISS